MRAAAVRRLGVAPAAARFDDDRPAHLVLADHLPRPRPRMLQLRMAPRGLAAEVCACSRCQWCRTHRRFPVPRPDHEPGAIILPPPRFVVPAGQRVILFNRKCSPFVPRARSVPAKRLTRQERQESAGLAYFFRGLDRARPHTRADCEHGPRPCPWVACRYNLYLDVTENGSLKLNFPDRDPDQMPPTGSCVLDIADRVHVGETLSLEDVGRLMNLGLERVRQITAVALQGARVKTMWAERLVPIRLPGKQGR